MDNEIRNEFDDRYGPDEEILRDRDLLIEIAGLTIARPITEEELKRVRNDEAGF